MTTTELEQKLGLTKLTSGTDERDVHGCYIGDLLSVVMSKAQADNVWVTVQININIIAVATLADVSCIIIPEEIVLSPDTLEKANAQDVIIFSSSKTAFELACAMKDLVG